MDNQKKILKLCDYLRQVASLRQKTVKNIREQEWSLTLGELPVDPKRIRRFAPGAELPEGAPEGLLLEVQKPDFVPCLELPFDLIGWVRTPRWKNFEVTDLEPYEERQKNDPRLGVVTERFVDSGVRLAAWEDWKRHRNLWRAGELAKSRTQKLFLELYGIYDRIRQDPERLELLVGNGVFLNGLQMELEHPLLLKKVRLHYDAEGNKMQVLDTESATEVYTELLQDLPGIEGPNMRAFAGIVEEAELHPLSEHLPKFLSRTAGQLSPHCRAAAEKFELLPTDWYLIFPRPVLFLRRHDEGTARAIAALAEAIEAGGEVPRSLLEIADPDYEPARVELPEEDEAAHLAAARGEAKDLLLAKPANGEQLAIVKEIEQASAVVVQGPPGTGKTHTIANLLGHFLAQGQHVLITSQSSKALSVLKDKLPGGMKDLCVSLLSDSREDMERSVAGICEMLSRHSAEELQAQADRLSRQREELLKRQAQVREQLDAVRRAESQRDFFVLGGKAWSLSRMAEFLHRHEELAGSLPGPLAPETPFPLKPGELAELYVLNADFTEESLKDLAGKLPASQKLLLPAQARKILQGRGERRQEEERLLAGLKQAGLNAQGEVCMDDLPVAEKLSPEHLREAQVFLLKLDFKLLEEPWARAAMLAGREGGARREVWEMLGSDIERVQQLKALAMKQQFGHKLEYKLSEPLSEELLQQLSEMAEAADANGGGLSWWIRLRHPEWKKVQQGFLLDGKPLARLKDCRMAMQYVSLGLAREQVHREWEQLLVPCGYPSLKELQAKAAGEDADDVASARWREVASMLDWYGETWSKLMALLERAGLKPALLLARREYLTPQARLQYELDWLEKELPRWLRLITLHYLEQPKEDLLAPTSEELAAASGQVTAELSAALQDCDPDRYEAAYGRLLHYEALLPRYKRRQALLAQLVPAAHHWAEMLLEQAGQEVLPPEKAEDAWTYEQLRMKMESLPKHDVETMAAEAGDIATALGEITQELAEKRAWQHLLEHVAGGSLQASLIGWSKAVQKIGRGKGKYAARHMREARRCMLEAQAAVPAWIMPLSRVWQNLRPDSPKFDLIIMDEASQADILALPLLYFARKAIIVGDDQQVSPADVGLAAEDVLQLQSANIEGVVAHASLYTMDTSLYDIAQMHFSARMLTEHFRSVPEIIGYSNKLCYGGRIQPLREAGTSPFSPLVDHLSSGIRAGKLNEGEAEELVALLAACLEQPEYKGKSFGAISMLGTEQPRLIRELAAERLGITVLEERHFLSGTPATFQGDERDIIFLSLVDSLEEGEGQLRLAGAGRGADRQKRYNVAVSRARDQLWVVHSMELSALKEGDIRRGLLEYVLAPDVSRSLQPEEEPTALESAVSSALLQAGYVTHLQYPLGSYRLGLVVICGRRRICIDCQGEHWYEPEQAAAAQRTQAVLQRLGWSFLRVLGSAWYRDPEQELDRLLSRLKALGLEPGMTETDREAGETRAALLERVQARARELLAEWAGTES